MKKPTEDELAEFMRLYAPRAFELIGVDPFPVNWPLEAAECFDHYEGTAKPNGDWCQASGKRISSWERTAQRWVRTTIRKAVDNARKTAHQPAPLFNQPPPPESVTQTPAAARAAIESFERMMRGEA